MCPLNKSQAWADINDILRNHLTACRAAKVDLEQNCFYDIVPEKFLLQYCSLRTDITEHVLKTCPKPENYGFLLQLVKMISKIKEQPLNVDSSSLIGYMALPRARALYKKMVRNPEQRIDYDAFRSKTGRLTTTKSSFPILTLDRNFRSIIKPNNDYFVELDFNAAELRTLLALSDKEQPKGDIHDWNIKNIYGGALTRDEAKKKIFAWLYNPESKDRFPATAYNRTAVLDKYFDKGFVRTPFDRLIPADHHHALNYIVQSTTSDLFLKRAIAVGEQLENKKSNIAFLLHDSLVIDFSKEDSSALGTLIESFSNTHFGEYVTNISVGKNFGSMRRHK